MTLRFVTCDDNLRWYLIDYVMTLRSVTCDDNLVFFDNMVMAMSFIKDCFVTCDDNRFVTCA